MACRLCLRGCCSLVSMTDPVFLFDPDTDDVPVNGDGLNAGWTITLPASVKRHALGAMRLAEGDGLSLTDGRGLCVKTTLVDAQAGLVSVERVGRQPQPVTRLVLIQALAKTGHDEAAIDMATQIGVDEVIPWQANRSIAKWKAGRRSVLPDAAGTGPSNTSPPCPRPS